MLQNIVRKFSTKQKESSLPFSVDLHSHLIPGIDDGVKDTQTSLEILSRLSDFGFKKAIITPHIMSHRFANTRDIIEKNHEKLQEAILKNGIDIQTEVGAEYYYDEHFVALINAKDLMTFGDNYVLFELSYTIKPFVLEQSVSKLLDAGYKPILAHPERYQYYKSVEDYARLKEMGLSFQINAISTQNFYGKNVKKSVEKIIDNGMVDFIGSDIHSHKYADAYNSFLLSNICHKISNKNQIKNDFL